MLLLVWLMDGS
jgi:hypothetical protein